MIFKLETLYFLIVFWAILQYPKSFCEAYRLPASLTNKVRPPCGGIGKGLFLALEIAIAVTAGALGYQFADEARASDPATVAKALGLQIVEAGRKMAIVKAVRGRLRKRNLKYVKALAATVAA